MDGLLLIAALGTFFLVFGVFNWFHPFLGTIGTDLFVDPDELDGVRLVLVRVLAVLMVLLGLWLLYESVYLMMSDVPFSYWIF